MYLKKIFIFLVLMVFSFHAKAEAPKSTGKYKNWQSFSTTTEKGKICFAQTIPTKRVSGSVKREESRLFVSFRPQENIKDEISITSGHPYKASSVSAKSGRNNFALFSQNNFAWLLDDKEEQKFIKIMKKATDLIIVARTIKGAETTDHYSMMGFTKAYNTAKKTCS
jgi:hypothetical protein